MEGAVNVDGANVRETSAELYGASGRLMWEWDALVMPVNERYVRVLFECAYPWRLTHPRGSEHWFLIVVVYPGALLHENSQDPL